jgi:hypothetical protein
MKTMKRREFVRTAAVGASGTTAAQGQSHAHPATNGPLASATVSFGQWPATAGIPLDRMVTPNAPVAPNIHELIPNTATIKAGGSINYVISGFHQIVVYAPGTIPSQISLATLIPIPDAPPAVGLIDDPLNRLYRGLSPIGQPQDRVEVLHFDVPGLYLVICAVSVHFLDNMFGWVRVLRG